MQQIPLRDHHGFLRREGATIAYVFCPETNGLRAVEKCQECEFHISMNIDEVKCKSCKAYNPPYYYNRYAYA